jgi:hypothetical protein
MARATSKARCFSMCVYGLPGVISGTKVGTCLSTSSRDQQMNVGAVSKMIECIKVFLLVWSVQSVKGGT